MNLEEDWPMVLFLAQDTSLSLMEESMNVHDRKEQLVRLSKFLAVLAAVPVLIRYAQVSVAPSVPPLVLNLSFVSLRKLVVQSLSGELMERIWYKA